MIVAAFLVLALTTFLLWDRADTFEPQVADHEKRTQQLEDLVDRLHEVPE